MANEIIIDREVFYLLTGKALTNSKKVLEFTTKIERLYNFGGTPTKEQVFYFTNLIKDYRVNSDNFIKELRELGKVTKIANKIKIKDETKT